MAPLDYALTNSYTDISPWNNAKDWLDADMNYVVSLIQLFATSLPGGAEIKYANFGGDMVYQVCLTASIFRSVVSTLITASDCLCLCAPDVLHA